MEETQKAGRYTDVAKEADEGYKVNQSLRGGLAKILGLTTGGHSSVNMINLLKCVHYMTRVRIK